LKFILLCLGTGEDNTENEGQSPNKKSKGKSGQTNKTKANKDAENETGEYQR
jgi:hypothetical protein